MTRTFFPHRRARLAVARAILLVAFGAQTAAAKDLILHSRSGVSGSAKPSEITQYWTAKKLVDDMDRVRVIADLEAKTITIVDKRAKTYDVRTFDEFRKVGEQAAAKLAETQKKMDEMPAEERGKLPPMVRAIVSMAKMQREGQDWTVKPTNKTQKIAGYEAKQYDVDSGVIRGTVWATEELQMPFRVDDAAAFRRLTNAVPRFGLNPMDLMERVKGVLLRTETNLPGPDGVTATMEVTEVKVQTAPADVLNVPAGFTKGTAPGLPPAGAENAAPAAPPAAPPAAVDKDGH